MSFYVSENRDSDSRALDAFIDVAEPAERSPHRGRWLAKGAMFLGAVAAGIAVYGLGKASGQIPDMGGLNLETASRTIETAGNYGLAVVGAVAASVACGAAALMRMGGHEPRHTATSNTEPFNVMQPPMVVDWPAPYTGTVYSTR
jgi:acetyl-CoA acetyltransferase